LLSLIAEPLIGKVALTSAYACRPVSGQKAGVLLKNARGGKKGTTRKGGKRKGSGRQKKMNFAEQFAAIRLAPAVNTAPVKMVSKQKAKVMLTQCTARYALACVDPFAPEARGACVPVGSAPSQKTHAFLRFDVTIGTSGAALLYFSPALSNDCASVFYTTSTWTGSTLMPFSAGGTLGASGSSATLNAGWTQGSHNGPYNSAKFITNEVNSTPNDTQVSGKIVSAGLRTQYTGTTLNESGLYYCYHDPSHSSVSGLSAANIGNFGDANVEGVSRKPCTLVVHAVDADEQNYSNSVVTNPTLAASVCPLIYPFSGGDYYWYSNYGSTTTGFAISQSIGGYGVPVGVPVGVIGMTGVAGQTVHVECILHFEYTGLAAAAMLTPTAPDIQGANNVITAALSVPAKKLDNPGKDVWSLMYEGLQEVAKTGIALAVPAAKAGLAMLLAP
jgi:hypothetical protein